MFIFAHGALRNAVGTRLLYLIGPSKYRNGEKRPNTTKDSERQEKTD